MLRGVRNTKASLNLTTTLAMAFVLMSIAAILISGSFGIYLLFQTEQDAIAGKHQAVAQQAGNAVAAFIQEKFSVMEATVRLSRSGQERKRALEVLLGLQPAFRQVLLLDAKNQKRFKVSRMSEAESKRLDNQLGNDPFSEVKDGNQYIGSVYVDQVTSEPLVIMAVPITNILGDILGTLVAEVNLKFMWDLVDRLKVGESGHAYVVDRKGLLIAFGDTGRVLRGEKLSHLKNVSEFMSNPFKKDKTGVKLSIGINGNMVMGTYVSLETPDWAVMTELPVKEAYRRVIHTAMIFAGILLVMAVLTGLMGVWVARRLAVPILNLTKTASRIAGGELGLKAMMEGPTEVTRLAGAFNHMTEQLCAMLDTEEERTRKLTQEVEHRKKAEESLKESSSILTANVEELRQLRNYLSNIINSMPSALVGVDTEERVTQWNRAVEESTGIVADVARGKKLSELIPWLVPETQTIAESIRTRQVRQEQKRPRQKKEEICYEDITIYPLIANGVDGAVIRIDDVTEKVRLEAMMIQSEKMLSVGGLAAGMAHEINNPLAGMVQTATVMAERLTNMSLPANHKAAEAAGTTMKAIENFMKARSIPRMIHAINESGRRVATIVDNMLSFARKSEATASSHTMESLIDKTIELAATDYDLKKHYDFKLIQVVKEYTDNLPLVPCEGAKIQQVLLNIFHNGAQAMQTAGTKNPMFVIRTRFDAKQHMVVMEIEDNGPGMNETVRKRVFEPFFTTKPVGVGTGLGLSVSYFIITENHGGIMTVESSPGAGAKFIIQLPVDRKT